MGFVPGVCPWGLALGVVPGVCPCGLPFDEGKPGRRRWGVPKVRNCRQFSSGGRCGKSWEVVGRCGKSWDFVGQSLRFRVIFLAKLDRLGSAVESEAQRQRASRAVPAVAAGAGTAALCAQTKAHSAACLGQHAESRCPKQRTMGISVRA